MQNDDIEKALKIAIVLTFGFFIVEVIGGMASGSLSLIGDAGHMLRDALALFISFSAIRIAEKLPTPAKTFGYHRTEILAALINGLLLAGISIWIFYEAYKRFLEPQPVESLTMFVVALVGLLINLYVARKLHGSHDLNVKSAFLHVTADAVSSIAVIFASIWIFFTGQTAIDPVLSVVLALFILISAFFIIRDSMHILLGFAPKNVDFDDVIKDMRKVKGVESVHNLHLWTLCSNINVIDAHVFTKCQKVSQTEKIKRQIRQSLEKYGIRHMTLEFECEECPDNDKTRGIRH